MRQLGHHGQEITAAPRLERHGEDLESWKASQWELQLLPLGQRGREAIPWLLPSLPSSLLHLLIMVNASLKPAEPGKERPDPSGSGKVKNGFQDK